MGGTSAEPRSLPDKRPRDFSRFSIADQSNASEADNNFEVNCKQRSRRRSSNVDGRCSDRAAVPGRWSRAYRAGDVDTTYGSSPVTPGPVRRQSTASQPGSPLNTAGHTVHPSSTHQAQHPQPADPSTTNGTKAHHDPVPSTFDFHPEEYTRPRSQELRERAQGRPSVSTLASIETSVLETPPRPLHAPEVAIEDSDADEGVNASAKKLVRVVGQGGGKEDDGLGPEVTREREEDKES